MKLTKNKNHIRGFTLIELLVVVSIIQLLASVVITSLYQARLKARMTVSVADLGKLNQAINLYYQDNGAYPLSSNPAGWDGLYTCVGFGGISTPTWVPGVVPNYIQSLPRDPRKLTDCGKQYLYRSNGIDYKLISNQTEDIVFITNKYPYLVDTLVRPTWAFGYWSTGAAAW